jgi:hypothetical protein
VINIFTCAPEDVYGPNAWFELFSKEDRIVRARKMDSNAVTVEAGDFIHWALLYEEERNAIWKSAKGI